MEMPKATRDPEDRYPNKLLLRMTDEQRSVVDRAAAKAGMSTTAWIRHRMEAAARRELR